LGLKGILMKQEYIQTLHPQEGKTNKRIALDKYILSMNADIGPEI
jgi:hypothetical protein